MPYQHEFSFAVIVFHGKIESRDRRAIFYDRSTSKFKAVVPVNQL